MHGVHDLCLIYPGVDVVVIVVLFYLLESTYV